jgi:hypothetical protein
VASFVVEDGSPMSIGISNTLVVERVDPGGGADTNGVVVGMRLAYFQSESTRGVASDEVKQLMARSQRPWKLEFDRGASISDTRTVFELVQYIKQDVRRATPYACHPLPAAMCMCCD